jgi:16S rRNA processing protein RimM
LQVKLVKKRVSASTSTSSTDVAEGHMDRIPVGYVRRPHGIRGDVVVRGLVDDATSKFIVGASFLTNEDPPAALTVAAVAPIKTDYRIHFEEVSDRNRSESLQGAQITVPSDQRRQLEDDEWWPEDLVGCLVLDTEGNEIATVREVIIGDAQDRLAVEARDGSKAEIPFVEAFVLKVDIANDEIIVDIPLGLFEPTDDGSS